MNMMISYQELVRTFPSYYMPGGDYQSAENFLAEMGADNVNESTIIENYKMAINVLSRVKV